jgi:peptide deformylase
MKLPILRYGHAMLREKCWDIGADYPQLDLLINDLFETMKKANGCGLAASQTGLPIRLFVVDSKSTFEKLDTINRALFFPSDDHGIIETIINARIVARSTETWSDDEGCLSIPGITQPIIRPWSITIEYYNRQFIRQRSIFAGSTARMIQHEYDHTEGILITDHLKPLQKKLLEGKLSRLIRQQRRRK